MSKSLFVLMALLFALASASSLWAQQTLPTMTATMTATPDLYQGACPVVIQLKGAINTTRPGRVHYKVIRSDGAYTPTDTAEFDTSGAKEVTASWTVGTEEQSRYEGWAMLKVTYPNEIESPRARFRVHCTGMAVDLPDLTIEDVTLDEQCRVLVKAKNIGPGPVFDAIWTDHKPDSSAITLYIGNKKWGGEAIWLLDPKRSLQNAGGAVTFATSLKVTGTQAIKARIDQTRQVKETDETNNERTVTLTCGAPAPEKQQ